MKYLKLFEGYQSESEVAKICDEWSIKNWSINSDGLVDVNDDVYLINRARIGLTYNLLKKLPLKFGHITGYFRVPHNNLTSLEGAPHTVGGYFNCSHNSLTSLEFAPKSVNGNFWCVGNNIRSFEGLVNIGGNFHCIDTQCGTGCNPVFEIWRIINDTNKWDNEKMEFFNDLDIIRGDEIAIDRLNFFLEEIGRPSVESVEGYKNIY